MKEIHGVCRMLPSKSQGGLSIPWSAQTKQSVLRGLIGSSRPPVTSCCWNIEKFGHELHMLFQFFWGYLAMKMRTTTCFNKSNKWKDLSCCFKYLFSGSLCLFVSSSFINSLLPWFDQLYSLVLLGYLPRFGPCFINFYGSTREYSDLPDEFDDLNIGVVSPHVYKRLIVYTLTVHQLFSLARSLLISFYHLTAYALR